MTIVLDISRALSSSIFDNMTGIDRVEWSLLHYLLVDQDHGDVLFLASNKGQKFLFQKDELQNVLHRAYKVRQLGSMTNSQECDQFTDLVAFLETEPQLYTDQLGVNKFFGHQNRSRRSYWRFLGFREAFEAFIRFKTKLMLPVLNWQYIHTSHMNINKANELNWTQRNDISVHVFLHDVIPLDYPEFCGDHSYFAHKTRLRNIAKHATSVVVNSHYTRQRISASLKDYTSRSIPISVSKLANDVNQTAVQKIEVIINSIYFICVGTIESRKNILFLLNVWRKIIEEGKAQHVPKLVILGKRGWKAESVFQVLDRSVQLSGHVVEASGFNDEQLRLLLRNATALLAPSLEEGFSLPPSEALAMGVPVIASDIPVHREILDNVATILDPTDGPGWRREIHRLSDSRARGASGERLKVGTVRRTTWTQFAIETINILSEYHQRDMK